MFWSELYPASLSRMRQRPGVKRERARTVKSRSLGDTPSARATTKSPYSVTRRDEQPRPRAARRNGGHRGTETDRKQKGAASTAPEQNRKSSENESTARRAASQTVDRLAGRAPLARIH